MDFEESGSFKHIIKAIAKEPMPEVTCSEQAALAQALAQVKLPQERTAVVPARSFGEFAGFVAASVTAFLVIFTLLALASFGKVDVISIAKTVGLVWIALAAITIVFVTSFVPVFITARRRPLNGMTFRA